jgi:mRNA-degrading endonuclease toxin of MazEF toxin-antitoxin module
MRPALVVQNDHGNLSETYPNTVVVTVSTKGRDIPFHVRIPKSPDNGLKADSYAKCEQILTIAKARLVGAPWGSVTPEEMSRIEAALKLSLALP